MALMSIVLVEKLHDYEFNPGFSVVKEPQDFASVVNMLFRSFAKNHIVVQINKRELQFNA